MKLGDFIELCMSREKCLSTLFRIKNKQYGDHDDVFANNKKAAAIAGREPEDFLMTQVAKHVGVLCARAATLAGLDTGIAQEEMEAWRENMDDVSLWMYILNGLLEERFQRDLAPTAVRKTCVCPDCQKKVDANGP